ncbi:MAG: succinoglycan biosynthesis protein ExoA, partial [Arenicella sp.]
MLPPLPEISIIIPTLNESAFIVECVESLLLGNYSTKRIELLIIDGGSTDDTVAKAEDLSRRYPSVKVLRNPMIIVPAAMNIGVRAASYDLLMWCGAHAIYDKDYVNLAVNTLLEESGAASVGGVISPIAKTATGKAIAIATSSKFGIGNAQYRYATTRQHVDTVFGGCFYKASIHKIGGFNQAWVRNQDYELNYRLRTQVGPIVLEPGIRCQYYCRESIAQLSKQYFAYGFWR